MRHKKKKKYFAASIVDCVNSLFLLSIIMGKISLQLKKLKICFARAWGDKCLEALPEETTNLAFSRASSEDSLVTCEESWTASNIDADGILHEIEDGIPKETLENVAGFSTWKENSSNDNYFLATEESLRNSCNDGVPTKTVEKSSSDNKIVDAIENMIELINKYPDSFPDLPFSDWEYNYVNSALGILPVFTGFCGSLKEDKGTYINLSAPSEMGKSEENNKITESPFLEYRFDLGKKGANSQRENDLPWPGNDISKGPLYILNLPSDLIEKKRSYVKSRKLLLKKKSTEFHNDLARF